MADESAQALKPGSARLARLDGLRGIAAASVAFGYHAQRLFTADSLAGYGPIVNWSVTWGWTFVDLFFVLSGFIFAHVYLSDANFRGARALADFAVARLARLYPLHLLMLVLVALVFQENAHNTLSAFVLNLGLMQAFVQPVPHSFVGPSWSISVEVICYVIFGITAALVRRALLVVTWAAMILGFLWLALLGPPGGPWGGDVFARGLFGFFAGQLLWRARGQLQRLPAPVLAGALLAGLTWDAGSWSPLLPLGLLAWPAALLLALRWRLLESRPLLWLGDRSYAIYLVHMPLIELYLKFAQPIAGGPLAVLSALAVLIGLVLAVADTSFRFLEQPARRAIRQSWDRRRSTRLGPVEPVLVKS